MCLLLLVVNLALMTVVDSLYLPNVKLNTTSLLQKFRYPTEVHGNILTEDGYILTLHRIPCGHKTDCSKHHKPAVLVAPPMFSSSWTVVAMGPNNSIPLLLADEGYDIWIVNFRGTNWSQKHITLSTDDVEFWNYSWHEMGYYDLAASIDYVIDKVKQQKIYFIGHSQGTNIFLVLMSTRPEYNKKIRISHLFAPPIWLDFKDRPIPMQHRRTLQFIEVFNKIPYNLLNPLFIILRKFIPIFAAQPLTSLFYPAINTLGGFSDPNKLNAKMVSLLVSRFPSTTTTKQILHYLQNMISGRFCYYNYGRLANLEIYGKEFPPDYNLSQVTAPVALYEASSDSLIRSLDVSNLAKACPNAVLLYKIPRKNFNHIDFVTASDLKDLVFTQLLGVMKKY